ncbi:glycosyltransferase family 22 protein [Mycena floridula]|nr:glycosyltransferase family 22 protein [Mycena floridula]
MTSLFLPLAVRLLIALFTRTYFQPDEYFQALEPAHHIVFGYGHLTWEWLSPHPIRSIIYPALNVPVYWVLKSTGLDSIAFWGDWLLIACPRLLHGALAALTDIGLCHLTRRTIGERYVSTALFLSLTSFFHSLSLARSLSNSLETSLTTIAFCYYPWNGIYNKSRTRKMIFFAALACSIRVTNAVIWIYLFLNLLFALRSRKRDFLQVLRDSIIIGGLMLWVVFMLDSLYYGKPTFTPLSFLTTNLSGVALFYGSNPWHYYISQAFPILCTTSLPFVLYGIWSIPRTNVVQRTMFGLIVWSILVYSLAGHKEWRFIHPLLPLLHLFAAKVLVDMSTQNYGTAGHGLPVHTSHLLILLLTIPVSLYTTLFYCSAPISVMSHIRNLPEKDLERSVGFLMPCHSTPGHAYLHREALSKQNQIWSLGCEPPLQNQDHHTYRDQTKVFYSSPQQYLIQRFPAKVNPAFPPSPFPMSKPGYPDPIQYPWVHEWPLNLIFFGALLDDEQIQNILQEKGYREVWKRGRFWEGDGDERKGGVRVWRWHPVEE